MKRVLSVVLTFLLVSSPIAPAKAQDFGIGHALELFKIPRVRGLEDLRKRSLRHLLPDQILLGDKFRKTFGAAVVATVGIAILGKLTVAERRVVSDRALMVLRGRPEQEVVDTYETNQGRRKVTIKASPVQLKAAFKDDPALKPDQTNKDVKDDKTAKSDRKDPISKDASGKASVEPVKVKDADNGTVSFDDVPEATKCRRVETQIADVNTSKGASDAVPNIETNASVVCELSENDWKPVKIREVAAKQ